MTMSLRASYPAYLEGRPFEPNLDLQVRNPYTGEMATTTPLADAPAIDQAIAAAAGAAGEMRRLPPSRRCEILRHCAARFIERRIELAHACCIESGKPIVAAEAEVQRLIDTFPSPPTSLCGLMGAR